MPSLDLMSRDIRGAAACLLPVLLFAMPLVAAPTMAQVGRSPLPVAT